MLIGDLKARCTYEIKERQTSNAQKLQVILELQDKNIFCAKI